MRYIVIGNSVAGLSACETIRNNDKNADIIVIADEPFFAYSRPLLSDYITGHVKIEDDRFHYRRNSFYDELRIEKKFGKRARQIIAKSKKILLDNSETIEYDKCLIATGGVPFMPPNMKNNSVEGVHFFTNLTYALELEKALKKAKKIVVVGAGLIGAKLAEKLSLYGFDVSIVELTNKILGLALDGPSSLLVAAQMSKAGVNVITEDSVNEILGTAKCEGVILASGKKIECDLAIMAIGVKPNTSVAKESGIAVNRGIAVSETMQTSVKDIYAAGDVVELHDTVFQMNHPIPVIPWAAVCGRIAGENMSGIYKSFNGGFPVNSISIGDISFVSMGYVETPDDCRQYINDERIDEGIYRKVIVKDGIIKGAVFMGDIERAGMVSAMIKDNTDVSTFAERIVENGFWWHSLDRTLREKLTGRA